jgi:hypothetical protein
MIFHNIKNGIKLDAYSNSDLASGQIWFDGVDFNLQAPVSGGLDISTGILLNSALNGSIYIIPSGNGHISVQVPDSTATGGNPRGTNAVDFQKSRGSANQVASGNNSIILGGSYHTASGVESAALGGYGNTASGNRSAVLGGNANTASGDQSTAISGNSHIVSGNQSAILGGSANAVSGDQAGILSGANNTANGLRSTVLGGDNNNVNADQAAIISGRLNNIYVTATKSVILGGMRNDIYTNSSVSMGQGSLTEAAFDFVIGNDASAAFASLNSNHFRIAGDTSDLHLGRYVDQAAVGAATNRLCFHTTDLFNQSKYVSFRAPPSGLTSYDLTLPVTQAPADGYFLTNNGSGALYWGNPVPNLLGIVNQLQAEVDAIEGSIGSSIDGYGQWLGFSGTNLLDPSSTLSDALEILDDGYQSLKLQLAEQSVSVVSINSNITLLKGKTYLVDTVAARTLTLPAPILNGYVAIKDKSGLSATNNITLNTSSGLIDGVASKTLAKNYGAWALVSDGTDWYFTVSSTAIYGV